MNHVTLTGRLATEPEIAFTPIGTPVTKFRLAVNDRVGIRERADFFTIKTYGPRGQTLVKHMTKGRLVAIAGTLRQESWTAKDSGEYRQQVIVVAYSVELLPDGRAPNAEQPEYVGSNPTVSEAPPTVPDGP